MVNGALHRKTRESRPLPDRAPPDRAGWFAYFAEEVLAGLDADLRGFVIRAAALPRDPGVYLFKVPINGSLALLLGLSALFVVSTLGMGIFISTISNTQQEATIMTMFTLLPSIFLSGFIYPLAAMPAILQAVSYVIPLRYFLVVVRGIIIKGAGLEALGNEVFALTIFGLIIMGAAATRFRKRLD